jgi:undecaprenyl-diphosphatase
MVTEIDILILALIQGLTEWLPISSSGHLVIMEKILGLNLPLMYNITLHIGTLIVVLTFFRKDVKDMIKAIISRNFKSEEGKFGVFIIIGSIPIAISGFLFYDFFKSLFSNLLAVGFALLITGFVLFFSEKKIGYKKIQNFDSLIIGLVQAITIIPGISRSGLTISAALLRKIDKTITFRYSFLLSVPAILGATLIDLKEFTVMNVDVVLLLLGVLASMIMGYVSLILLRRLVLNGKIHFFAYYCWAIGIILIFFLISK